MVRPTEHPKSGVYRIRMRVPKDLIPVIGKRERIESLGTKDPKEAIKRAPAAVAKIKAEFTAARAAAGPARRLTHREVMALCGDWYRDFLAHWEEDPGDPADWEEFAALMVSKLEDVEQDGPVALKQERQELADARRFLASKGIPADEDTTRRFALALMETKLKAAVTLRARSAGDYSPDPHVATFPKPQGAEAQKPPLPADELMRAWAAERKPAKATIQAYGGKFRTFIRIIGFDDVRRITPDDVVKFKRHRLEVEKRDTGTVEDDIRNMGAVCNWAVTNRLLDTNPFEKLAPKPARWGKEGRAGYDDDEARRILSAARAETGWLRWAPWLLCFTGARIGELAELRRRHLKMDSGVLVLDFKPKADGSGNNKTMQRMVPLHPALEEEGFLDYVATLPADPDGPLFPSVKPDPHGSRVNPATDQLGRWMRDKVGIKDPNKAPAHSWRHRMQDELRKVRALPEVVDALTGRHNPRNAGDGYGKGFRGMPAEVLKELRLIPSPVPPLRPLPQPAAMPVPPAAE